METDIATVAPARLRVARLLVVGSLLAGAVLVSSASPSAAWDSLCNNGEELTPGVPPSGDEVYVDVSSLVLVGVDLETHDLLAGNPDPGVCVNNELYNVTVTTTGGPYVSAGICTGTACTSTFELGATGLVATSSPSTMVSSTTVCVGVCTDAPFTPIKVDTGYDVYVDGSKQADVCVSVGTGC